MREYKKRGCKLIATAFASWLNLHKWEIDFREERDVPYDELFDMFIHETKFIKKW